MTRYEPSPGYAGELPPEPPAVLCCPNCGSMKIAVARNIQSTGHCGDCHYEEDDAYRTMRAPRAFQSTSAHETIHEIAARVRAAVESMRERAAEIVESTFTDEERSFAEGKALAASIRALPLETP